MRLTRLSIVVVLLSVSSLAQMRGGGARGFVGRPGVVVSPHHGVGFVGGHNRPFPNNGPFVPSGFRHGFRHFNSFPVWGGIWDGFYAYPGYEDDYADDTQPEVQQAPVLPSRLEVTIVDPREKESEDPPAEKLPNAKLIELPAEPAIFIFKDGTRKEMTSYAITGGQLIDLSKGKAFRSPLDQINRNATLAANAKAGHEIQLP